MEQALERIRQEEKNIAVINSRIKEAESLKEQFEILVINPKSDVDSIKKALNDYIELLQDINVEIEKAYINIIKFKKLLQDDDPDRYENIDLATKIEKINSLKNNITDNLENAMNTRKKLNSESGPNNFVLLNIRRKRREKTTRKKKKTTRRRKNIERLKEEKKLTAMTSME